MGPPHEARQRWGWGGWSSMDRRAQGAWAGQSYMENCSGDSEDLTGPQRCPPHWRAAPLQPLLGKLTPPKLRSQGGSPQPSLVHRAVSSAQRPSQLHCFSTGPRPKPQPLLVPFLPSSRTFNPSNSKSAWIFHFSSLLPPSCQVVPQLPFLACHQLVSIEQPPQAVFPSATGIIPTFHQGNKALPSSAFPTTLPALNRLAVLCWPSFQSQMAKFIPPWASAPGSFTAWTDYPLRFQFNLKCHLLRGLPWPEDKVPAYPHPCHLPTSLSLYVLWCGNNINLICLPITLPEYKLWEERTHLSCFLYPKG